MADKDEKSDIINDGLTDSLTPSLTDRGNAGAIASKKAYTSALNLICV